MDAQSKLSQTELAQIVENIDELVALSVRSERGCEPYKELCNEVNAATDLLATIKDDQISKLRLQEVQRLGHIAYIVIKNPWMAPALQILQHFVREELSSALVENGPRFLEIQNDLSVYQRLHQLLGLLLLHETSDELTLEDAAQEVLTYMIDLRLSYLTYLKDEDWAVDTVPPSDLLTISAKILSKLSGPAHDNLVDLVSGVFASKFDILEFQSVADGLGYELTKNGFEWEGRAERIVTSTLSKMKERNVVLSKASTENKTQIHRLETEIETLKASFCAVEGMIANLAQSSKSFQAELQDVRGSKETAELKERLAKSETEKGDLEAAVAELRSRNASLKEKSKEEEQAHQEERSHAKKEAENLQQEVYQYQSLYKTEKAAHDKVIPTPPSTEYVDHVTEKLRQAQKELAKTQKEIKHHQIHGINLEYERADLLAELSTLSDHLAAKEKAFDQITKCHHNELDVREKKLKQLTSTNQALAANICKLHFKNRDLELKISELENPREDPEGIGEEDEHSVKLWLAGGRSLHDHETDSSFDGPATPTSSDDAECLISAPGPTSLKAVIEEFIAGKEKEGAANGWIFDED